MCQGNTSRSQLGEDAWAWPLGKGALAWPVGKGAWPV